MNRRGVHSSASFTGVTTANPCRCCECPNWAVHGCHCPPNNNITREDLAEFMAWEKTRMARRMKDPEWERIDPIANGYPCIPTGCPPRGAHPCGCKLPGTRSATAWGTRPVRADYEFDTSDGCKPPCQEEHGSSFCPEMTDPAGTGSHTFQTQETRPNDSDVTTLPFVAPKYRVCNATRPLTQPVSTVGRRLRAPLNRYCVPRGATTFTESADDYARANRCDPCGRYLPGLVSQYRVSARQSPGSWNSPRVYNNQLLTTDPLRRPALGDSHFNETYTKSTQRLVDAKRTLGHVHALQAKNAQRQIALQNTLGNVPEVHFRRPTRGNA